MFKLPLFLAFLLLGFTTFPHPANANGDHLPCPKGWLTYRGSRSCYRLAGTSNNWMEARKACFAMGGDLVKIRSAQENSYVWLLASTIPKHNHHLWIGLVRDGNNKFMWVDGSRLSGQYSNWNTGEPNYIQEKCALMYLNGTQKNMKWNDGMCKCPSSYAYICEKKSMCF